MEHDERMQSLLDELRSRIEAIENHLGIEAPARSVPAEESAERMSPAERPKDIEEEELEYELGQSWFARAGIAAFALGIAFLLVLPFETVPQLVVSVFAYLLAGGMFALSRAWRESLTLLSNYLRGAGMALMYFATLRLTYFSDQPVLSPDSTISFLPLVIVSAASFVLAARRGSLYLTLLALTQGYATLVALQSPELLFAGLLLLAGYVVHLSVSHRWIGLLLTSMLMSAFTFLHWGVGEPILTGSFAMAADPEWSVIVPLLLSCVFAVAIVRRQDQTAEGYDVVAAAVIGGGSAYALVLTFTLVSFEHSMIAWHTLAAAVFLGIAVTFWLRERSRYSTFVYAMLGYQALTVALLKGFEVPEVFVWLSVQSLVVVATAVWFRSRFIVVMNFLIYIVVFLGYLLVAEQESGFSFAFGIVALVSARILNWQREHLELRTDAMRNAYLAAAFVVIPYSLYHVFPSEYTALSWVGVALMYYLMSAVINNQKYRWMGHFTLMLTALYVVAVGIIQLETTFRVVSFLVLGVVLLGTSVFFTRRRIRRSTELTRDGSSEDNSQD